MPVLPSRTLDLASRPKKRSASMVSSRQRSLSTVDLAAPLAKEPVPLFTIRDIECFDVIGVGGQATVYRGHHLKYNQTVAVKIMNITPEDGLECDAEVEAMRNITCPFVIACYDAFVDGDKGVFVYEYCKGGTIMDAIQDAQKAGKQGLSMVDFRRMASQIIAGLSCIHSMGFAHKDIKVSNILFADSERQIVRVTDFGLSARGRQVTQNEPAVGTPAYIAPESWMGRAYDPMAADIWALGVTFCAMLEGKLPWTGSTMQDQVKQIVSGEVAIPRSVPADVAAVIQRMLSPESRRIKLEELREFFPLTSAPSARAMLHRPIPNASRRAGAGAAVRMTRQIICVCHGEDDE